MSHNPLSTSARWGRPGLLEPGGPFLRKKNKIPKKALYSFIKQYHRILYLLALNANLQEWIGRVCVAHMPVRKNFWLLRSMENLYPSQLVSILTIVLPARAR